MAALSADAKREKRGTLLRTLEVVAAVDICYAGGAACTNAAGYAAPVTATAADRFQGVFSEQCDNSGGSAGDLKAKIDQYSVMRWTSSGLAQSDIGEDVWFSDDQTITKTVGNCYAGVIEEFISATEVWVNHLPAYAASEGFTGAYQINSTLTVGVDDTGHDVKFFGDTASSYLLWDQSADKLIINAGTADLGTSCEADAYTVGGVAGADFNGAVTNLTAVKGIVTAAS